MTLQTLSNGGRAKIYSVNNYYRAFESYIKASYKELDFENFFISSNVDFTQISEKRNSFSSRSINGLFLDFYRKQKYWFFTLLFLLLILFWALKTNFLHTMTMEQEHSQNLKKEEINLIRSDLIIPTESSLLHRPELLTKIDDKLKGKSEIKTIALVGTGGTGKTTLARQYARLQKAKVIWEINAESVETLKTSFENLALALAEKEEDKIILRKIQQHKDPSEREEKIILFVKKQLHSSENWILIYDNVESFEDIQKHFPHDSITWGKGIVILTTSNSNIQHNTHIDNILQIGELSSSQKLALFIKIMSHRDEHVFTSTETEEAKKFLEEIPPFPLDISIAAYYLKSTNASYNIYLDNIKKCNENFVHMQENLLKEVGNYRKTRYSIVSICLESLLRSHKDFKDILLFICLLDSQNIPIDLLLRCKNNVIIDNFIYNLKKYSLIITPSFNLLKTTIRTCSIHRSIQEISRTYLLQVLNLKNSAQLLEFISDTLKKYMADSIEKRDFLRMELLVSHCKHFLNHEYLLTSNTMGSLKVTLGRVYYYLGYYMQAKKIIEESLNKIDSKNYLILSQALTYLGNIYVELGDFEKAKDLLEKNLKIHQGYFPENNIDVARIMACLGNAYRQLALYEKAKYFLEKSLMIYQKYYPENFLEMAEILEYLGNFHRYSKNYSQAKFFLEKCLKIYENKFPENLMDLACTKIYLGNVYKELKEYERAEILIKEGVEIYEKNFPERRIDIAWGLAYLGDLYKHAGKFEKAKHILEKSVEMHQHVFGNNNARTAWALNFLGDVYKEQKNYQQAETNFQKIFAIYEKNYGKNNIETAQIIMKLIQIYLLQGKITSAESYISNSLESLKKYQIRDILVALEDLSDLLSKKSLSSIHEGNFSQAKKFKMQAISYLEQVLSITQEYFPENSQLIIKIQSKLKNFVASTKGV
ncbi:MAG: tetratricopeptide repeat protein [Candidatus Paracaedimonas acanthamoebae]|uniref:Tetratricopeptide repeat protein n=1 Tax=Candidatus Paracaedimonas acanthamoebae TaxID=244581 RepID=A0A8J7PYA0_9PROT|nr:tetratricopeptide repeat protein [Candidatus Paracaedimonas acanthamoebae]